MAEAQWLILKGIAKGNNFLALNRVTKTVLANINVETWAHIRHSVE